jgi:hypothetical protein
MPDDPKGYTGSFGFQTKDFDCALQIYIIDKDGQLSIERREVEWIEGDEKAKNFLDKVGYPKTTKTWLEPLNYTGVIQFYDYLNSNNTDYDYWIQYEAKFIDGKSENIKLINFEANSNFKRKERDAKFEIELKKQRELCKTFRYKYLIKPYNESIKFLFRKLFKILNHANINIWQIENKFIIK